MGPKTEKDLFPKVSRERIEELSAERCQESAASRGTAWMKKVRNRRWHTVLIDTLKTETSNFVLNPSLHWKPAKSSEQSCCTCISGLTEDKSGCMILYVLKFIHFVVIPARRELQ